MKSWFGPMPGNNTRYYDGGIGLNAAIMPVSWEGWLATLAYIAIQGGVLFGGIEILGYFHGQQAIAFLPMVPLHLAFLWFASRHFQSYDEVDPSVLTADERPPHMRN